MKRFLMLMPLVAVGLVISGLTTAGSVTAGVAHGTGGHLAHVHVINLHAGYEARLGHTTVGDPSGYEYAQGMPPSLGRGGNECPEPYCPVSYDGGPVQLHPHVYLLLWGPNWQSDPNQENTAAYLEKFYSGLGVQPEDNWSTVTSQYGDSSGDPAFSGSVLVGTYNDTSTPTSGLGADALAAEADTFATRQGITDLADAQIVVATQSGTCPAGFYAPSVCGSDGGYYCSWHDYSNEPFVNLPYMLDAGTSCGENFVNHTNGTYDGLTISAGHEYAETITDPQPDTAWFDPDEPDGDGEIADKCEWSSNSSNVALSTGSFAMQPLWSNSANNTNGSCVMPIGGGGGGDVVAIASPGNQADYNGTALSLDVAGTSSDGYPLTWTATGLPPGLTITSTGTPAVISGQIEAAAGTYPVTLEVSDSTGASALTSFDWTVQADVGKDVKNTASGLCLNDYNYSITPGNHVVVYKCLDGPAEKITHPSKTRELIVLGQCLSDSGKGAAGAPQVVEPCTGASTQVWYYNSKHEWVLSSNQLCLTDPNGSTVNGTPVEIEKCTDAKDQQWSEV
jgi:hypothetical protein